MKTMAALGIMIMSILPAQSAVAASRDSSRMKNILVFGDSLSEGFMLRQSDAYPMLLVQKLRAAGLDYEVSNISQSGGTTQSGLARLAARLKHKIDIFILELGINDAFGGVPVGQIRDNLQEIIDRVKRANPSVRTIVVGMQRPNYSADDYINDFGKMYVDLAAKNNAGLVPYLLEGVAGDPVLNLPDRIHPNAAGHKVLVENVWRVLEPIARQVAIIPSGREGPHLRSSITQ